MNLENKNIIIVSGEAWGPVWYSKHNYAWQLSQKNKVYFINPPQKFSPFNAFKTNLTCTKITESLKVLTYKNVLPVKTEWLRLLNENYVFKKINSFFKSEKVTELIFWSFDPIRLSSPDKLNSTLVILHAVDHYLFTYPAEAILAKRADAIFCVSDGIAKSYLKHNQNVFVIPHAIPGDEFLPVKKEVSKPLLGIFTGTLDLRIDFAYTQFIVEKFPEVTFKFVGKIKIKNSFTDKLLSKGFKNVIYEHEKPFGEIKHLIRQADFCFLFKDNNVSGNNISSHKMLQYLAQGKPVFCSELSLHNEISHLLNMDNDRQKMEKLFRTFIEHGDKTELVEKRIEHAKEHSFDTTLKKIEQFLA